MIDPFIILNSLVRVIIMLLIAYKLMVFHEMLNRVERVGLGIAGGTGFLTIPVIFAAGTFRTPFDGWAGMMFSTGFLIYLCGRMSRHIRHQRANSRAAADASGYLKSRGKL